ncbi:uncharacterized protein LOC116287256 [Actinia tenebrosa]|uniref:Uncharacterized protein LOC116287256 n=1 Tax=Actinia tenebrosa TaxID=6105 RepID=A0A6P8H028_ACTTE|nr:uncharacterized protein LOC116287256 [Actinia tenebrosa]XP_031549779.1 uncharacterized protein LOC116287256 [Actinia tenebrosa]XP_031549780.1 uncharacterized protein LOC116287256 [Actinia tenebrosa]
MEANLSPTQQYQCKYGHTQDVSIQDIEEEYKYTEELSKRLREIYAPIGFIPLDKYSASMKVESKCKTCQASIDVIIEVNGTPLWNYHSYEDFELWIDNFSDIRILQVFPAGTDVVGYHLDEFIEESSLEPEFDYLPDIEDVQKTQEEEQFINLNIIVQTRMKKGYCHLGFDSQSGRILRPFYRPIDGSCCWDTPLQIDKTYVFRILSSPRDGPKRLTPLPHNNEDLLVDNQAIKRESNETASPDIFQRLKKLSKSSVEEIFGPGIKENKYVDEGTDCPSVGVLGCMGSDLEMIRDPFEYRKRRVKISGGYEPRFTAIDAEHIPEDLPDNPTLVVLGLGRPFAGTGQNHFDPRRCYILVLRILQNP